MKAEGSAQSPDALHVRENCIHTAEVGLLELITPKVRESPKVFLNGRVPLAAAHLAHTPGTEDGTPSSSVCFLKSKPGTEANLPITTLLASNSSFSTCSTHRVMPYRKASRPPLETSSARQNTRRLTRVLPLPHSKARIINRVLTQVWLEITPALNGVFP